MDSREQPPPDGESGPLLFARYAYPPNSLGYCGPSDTLSLFEAAGARDLCELRGLARHFDGAWPYLQLIAAANGITDPLDQAVVEAYWVGNDLARRVGPQLLARSLEDRFSTRASRRLPNLVSAALSGGVAQHSFHVFAVYPWLGLLRSGTRDGPLEVLDKCRIRWGSVEAVAGDTVLVRSKGLTFEGSRLSLGPERLEEARCGLDGQSLAADLRPGDRVSLHWDWVCERLSPASERWLRACTRQNLDAVNRLPVPGPAAVCEA